MKRNKSRLWITLAAAPLVVLVCFCFDLPAAKKEAPVIGVRFAEPIKTDPKTWLADQVHAGKDVYLSANYLFQVMKLRSQKALMEFEAATLYPTLMEVTDWMKQMGVSGDALVFVETARRLLNPQAEVWPDLKEEVEKRVAAFTDDPQNTPRGHYANSEELKRYFRGMQFLAKATFDVKVDTGWFADRAYMLFPFEAAVELMNSLSDPKNSPARGRLMQIHTFYDRLVGPADLPSFRDLLTDKPELEREAVVEYAKKRDLPKINKGMGIGIQVLGERFATHQLIVEKLSERFLAQDPKVNRSKAFEVLQFNNIFLGKTEGKVRVPGLAAAKVDLSDPNILYYNLCLGAIVTLPGVKNSAHMMNAAAASLTALAEQTILVTKQTTFMPKSALLEEEKKKPVSIYVQPRIQDFLKTLSRAEENLYASCGLKPATDPYKMLAQASSNGKPIKSDSPEGIEVLNLVTPLAFDPTVTADVFFYSGRSDKAFLQWAIGPFEVEYTVGKNKTATGMEMVFFEGWHDTIRPGSKKPMTNDEWRAAFEQGQYKELGSLVLGKRSGRR